MQYENKDERWRVKIDFWKIDFQKIDLLSNGIWERFISIYYFCCGIIENRCAVFDIAHEYNSAQAYAMEIECKKLFARIGEAHFIFVYRL